jgi:hypothetical protein
LLRATRSIETSDCLLAEIQPPIIRIGAGAKGQADAELPGAQQRHVGEAEQPRGVGGELRGEIRGGREDDGDDVVGREVVALQHGGDELGRSLEDLLAGVAVHLDGAPDRAYRHYIPTDR